MGRIKDLNSSVPGETDNLVFDGLNGTKRISYADFKQKLIDDGFGSGSSEAVVLTQAEYDALPDEVKDSDTIFFISDAPFENSNVVTLTSAQYAALSDATKMDGRFYYVTDEEEVAKSLVVQENVNSTETVPSSAVLYALNETNADAIGELSDPPNDGYTVLVSNITKLNELVVKIGCMVFFQIAFTVTGDTAIPSTTRIFELPYTSAMRGDYDVHTINGDVYSDLYLGVNTKQLMVNGIALQAGGRGYVATGFYYTND